MFGQLLSFINHFLTFTELPGNCLKSLSKIYQLVRYILKISNSNKIWQHLSVNVTFLKSKLINKLILTSFVSFTITSISGSKYQVKFSKGWCITLRTNFDWPPLYGLFAFFNWSMVLAWVLLARVRFRVPYCDQMTTGTPRPPIGIRLPLRPLVLTAKCKPITNGMPFLAMWLTSPPTWVTMRRYSHLRLVSVWLFSEVSPKRL